MGKNRAIRFLTLALGLLGSLAWCPRSSEAYLRQDSARECAKNLEAPQGFSWENWSEETRQSLVKLVHRNLDVFMQRPEDPFVKFLGRAGFRFFPRIQAPSGRELMEFLAHEAKANLDVELLPAQAFRNAANEFIFLPYGAPIPAGYELFDRILPSAEWSKAIARKMLPMGGNSLGPIRGERVSLFWHGLAHWSGLLDHPDYTSEMVWAYEDHIRESISYSSNGIGGSSPLDYRMFHAVEAVEYIPKDREQPLRDLLLLPPGENLESRITVSEMEAFLSDLSDEELHVRLVHLWTQLPRLVVRVGGALRDVVFHHDIFDVNPHKHPEFVPMFWTWSGHHITIKRFIDQSKESSVSRESLIHHLAWLQVFSMTLWQLEPWQWMQDAALPPEKQLGFIRWTICESGLYSPKHMDFSNFCGPI